MHIIDVCCLDVYTVAVKNTLKLLVIQIAFFHREDKKEIVVSDLRTLFMLFLAR